MWAGKWIVSSIVLDTDVFGEAFSRLTVHSGETNIDGESINVFGALWRNVRILLRWPYFLMGLFFLAYYLRKIIPNFKNNMIIQNMPLLILCIIPCIWLMMLKSHSAWCYWYTYRNLSVSVFSVSVFVCRLAADQKTKYLC